MVRLQNFAGGHRASGSQQAKALHWDVNLVFIVPDDIEGDFQVDSGRGPVEVFCSFSSSAQKHSQLSVLDTKSESLSCNIAVIGIREDTKTFFFPQDSFPLLCSLMFSSPPFRSPSDMVLSNHH